MGAWGVGIIVDDVVCAYGIVLLDVFRDGQSANAATETIMKYLRDLN